MTFALTDKSAFSVAVEATPGVLGGSPAWEYLEINTQNSWGETLGMTVPNPISADRMRRRGLLTSLDSSVGFDADIYRSLFKKFSQGFMFSTWKAQDTFTPTAVVTSGYTVASGGDLAAGTLVYARNFSNATNNGLHITTTSTLTTEIEVTDTLVAEASPPTGAIVDVVGVQGASGDITMDSSGNLASTVLDFTTLGLNVGQVIYIGGGTTATSFATSGDGFARVKAISANALTLDDVPAAFTTDAGTGKTIQIFIGSWIRNVPYNSGDFLIETYSFEGTIALDTPEYVYPNGNYANELALTMNMEDKVTGAFGFVGLNTPAPTTSRASGTWSNPVDTYRMNTSSDFAKISLKTSSGTTIVSSSSSVVTDLSANITNGVTIKKAVGAFGGVGAAFGNFGIDLTFNLYVDSTNAKVSVRNNDVVTMSWCINNDNGGLYFDIPSMSLGDGTFNFTANDTVTISLTAADFKDTFYGFSFGVTDFPYLPV